jgi:hypothetical protein
VVFEALNGTTIPKDLRLSYEVTSYGKTSPSTKTIRTAVERWAAEHADAARAGEDVREVFVVDDWRFRLALMSGFKPRPGGRQIAVYGVMNGRIVGPAPSAKGLAKALDTKATNTESLICPMSSPFSIVPAALLGSAVIQEGGGSTARRGGR